MKKMIAKQLLHLVPLMKAPVVCRRRMATSVLRYVT